MVQTCFIATNAATTTPVRTTTGKLQQVQQRPQGGYGNHDKAYKTSIAATTDLMASTEAHMPEYSFKLKRQASMKMTSIKSENELGNKSSMPRSDKQIFVAPVMVAKGRGKKLYELYTSKSQSTSLINGGAATDNDDNDDASFLEDDAISFLEDEDLHIP
ncbi:hypothetical protein Cgig2_025462 [Carnegiea gigantea]|uniref:Uncharacterized protein n=1 Tax=Carnegiea gigantea TaxID=171969 RepID=A0A9Q1JT79_9CARY|nr:hypothetical protein Cgig2_025462 [Carnegiea gigantea]